MRMFSRLRAVEDLEPLPLPEAEVILRPRLVVIEGHEEGHPCGRATARSHDQLGGGEGHLTFKMKRPKHTLYVNKIQFLFYFYVNSMT